MPSTYTGRAAQRFRLLVWADACARERTGSPTCHLCGTRIDSFDEYEPDHLVPVSVGGAPLDLSNARPAHGRRSAAHLRCNPRRQAAPLELEQLAVDARRFFSRRADAGPDLPLVPPPVPQKAPEPARPATIRLATDRSTREAVSHG